MERRACSYVWRGEHVVMYHNRTASFSYNKYVYGMLLLLFCCCPDSCCFECEEEQTWWMIDVIIGLSCGSSMIMIRQSFTSYTQKLFLLLIKTLFDTISFITTVKSSLTPHYNKIQFNLYNINEKL